MVALLMLALVVHAGGEAPPGTPLEVYRTRSALPPEVAKKVPKALDSTSSCSRDQVA